MIIKSIAITNFLSYYETTEFKFDEGATLIIGQNNTGKSKLFDAYNWVLYDEAYETADENWLETSKWKERLVNSHAKKNCAIHSRVEVSVSLHFVDEARNMFVVTRDYRIQKLSESEWSCPNSSNLAITKTTPSNYNSINYDETESKNLLAIYFPKNLSRYFLFQGEGISRLLRLNQRSDFTKAIGELSGIKYFDKARRYADKVYTRAKQEFEDKEEKDEVIQNEKTVLTARMDEFQERIADFSRKLENEYRERAIRQKTLDEKEDELSRYEECAQLLQDIKGLEQQRDVQVEQRKKIFEYRRPDLLATWIYRKTSKEFSHFLQLYRKGKEEKKIPEPIRQDFIREMLQEHICKVCGTEAPEHSSQYQRIAGFINEKSLDREVAAINALSDTADSMQVAINEVPDEVARFKTELQTIEQEIETIREKIGVKENELRVVTERIEEEKKIQISREDLERVNLTQLTRDRDHIRNDLEQSRSKIDQLLGRKEEAEKSYKELKEDYDRLIEKSTNESEKDRMKFAGEIRERVYQLYNNFLAKLIKDIEDEANIYFANMTKTNLALSGRVRVDYDKEEVYTVDESGAPLTNINQANKVSLQISFVAAVLSVSNKIWEKHFPFVADAPISALGGNNKISAIKTIIDIFRQSIVILKDDADIDSSDSIQNDQVRQLIRLNSKIKMAYELRMVGASIEDQRTTKIQLK